MSRPVSSAFLAAVNAPETDQVPIILLTLTHPSLGTTIYISSDPTTRISDDPPTYATQSRGNDYLFLPFQITLPEDRDDSPLKTLVVMDNIDRSLTALLRSISTPMNVKVELVLSGQPDVVDVEMPVTQMADFTLTDKVVSFSLEVDGYTNEPFPSQTFTPSRFSGIT